MINLYNKKNMLKKILIFLFVAMAQYVLANTLPDPTKYHVDIKERNLNKSTKAYLLRDSTLYFKFEEYYAAGKLQLAMKDTRGKIIFEKELEKQKGINYYAENLLEDPYSWKEGSYYVLELSNARNEKYELLFQMGRVPKLPKPTGDIAVNPVHIECDSESNLVEYAGEIEGGRAPYKVTWKISKDAEGKELLYAPKEMEVEKEGRVPGIAVTNGLGYFVIMEIVDNCNKEGRQIAKIECEEQKNESLLHLEFLDNKPKYTN